MGDTSTSSFPPEKTGGTFALVEEQGPARNERSPCTCTEEDMESFYVLEGEITLYIGDQAGVQGERRLVRARPRWDGARIPRRIRKPPAI